MVIHSKGFFASQSYFSGKGGSPKFDSRVFGPADKLNAESKFTRVAENCCHYGFEMFTQY